VKTKKDVCILGNSGVGFVKLGVLGEVFGLVWESSTI
jgi:hypothetical protein